MSSPSNTVEATIIRSVRALGAYTLKATEARVKLNQNESPWDLPADAKKRILDRVAACPWNRYPDFHPADVLKGIGALHGLPAESVLIGNGSNELIQALFAAIVEPGVRVAYPVPTCTLYAMMIAANGGVGVQVPAPAELGYDFDTWLRLAEANEAHLLICSPNNPTGAVLGDAQISALARATNKLVIVDEAYAQFAPTDAAALVREHSNLVVLRTFSKAVGLAGVRFGYAIAHPDIAREISKVKLPYNVGLLGLEVAREVLANPQWMRGASDALCAERGRLFTALQASEFDEVIPSHANFVLARTAEAKPLFDALYAKGILVRDVGHYPMLDNCLRFSVGTPAQNDELIQSIRTFFAART